MLQIAESILCLFLLFFCCKGSTAGGSWSYDNKSPDGPLNWGNQFPVCKMRRQSPIDIQLTLTQSVPSVMPEFIFSRGYFNIDKFHNILNNGHTIQLDISTQDKRISGGDLGSTYRLVQLHMHWGKTDDVGSEHLLDGKSYPLEIHLVHFDEVNFESVEAAKKSGTGLAVLGIMAKVGGVENRALQSIIDALSAVRYAGTNENFNKTFPIIDLLPSNHDNYFRYLGSLTTPPCLESVVWTVFQKPIMVSSNQMKELRNVLHNKMNDHEEPLVNNFRPVQKLNGRKVKRSFFVRGDLSSSVIMPHASIILPFVMAMAVGSLKFM